MFRTILLLACLAAGCGAGPPPSILLVSIDTLRADALGCYGNAASRTPRADRLAAEGVRFETCVTPCPLTLPAHATILTGLPPPSHDLRDNDPPRPLPPAANRPFRTVAEELQSRGYTTAAFVSSSVLAARTGLDAGFSVYDGPDSAVPGEVRYAERAGGDTARAAASWLASSPRPFFLFVHLFDPHDPYEAPAAFRRGAAPGTPEAYAEEVAYADSCLGVLLDALHAAGHEPDTFVLFASDHGEGLGEHGEATHGYLLTEATLRVPLLLRWPGRLPAGAARADPVGLGSVATAILEAAGAAATTSSTLLHGPAGDGPLCSETLYGYRRMGWAQLFAAREGTVKLVRGNRTECYDLAADPREEASRPDVPVALAAAMERYRSLAPLAEPVGTGLPELAGFPYAAGIGRSRLRVLPWAENEALPSPDGRFAARFDRLASVVGRDPAAEAGLLELAAEAPANPSVAFWLGRAHRHSAHWPDAARAFGRAFDSGLREAKVLDLWLQALLLVPDLAEADRVASRHVAEVVPDTGTWLMLAVLRHHQGRIDEAASLLARADAAAVTDADRLEVSRFRHNLGIQNDK
ncbi:MAG: sulfatase [Planctomycetes bacterium]|nr:sulfatase [Planctomycetota bacterium]